MQRHPFLTLKRVQKFLSEPEFGGRVFADRAPVRLSVYSAPGRISWTEALAGTYRETCLGEKFGPIWSTHWFRVGIEIPREWAGRPVHLLWDTGSEACVWPDGQPMQGLTRSEFRLAGPSGRKDYRLISNPSRGGRVRVSVEIAC